MLLPSVINSTQQKQVFRPLAIDPAILGGALAARLALSAASSSTANAIFNAPQEPAVIPPWKINTAPQSLARRLSEVRNLTQFIDLKSDAVKSAGENADRRATFAIFEALTALQTLAQAAAEANRSTAELPRLNDKFRQGLAELRDFVTSAELDKLNLLFGEKKNRVTSAVSLGADATDYTGQVFSTAARDQAVAGLTGTEQFTVTITKSGVAEDILVDLSGIAGPLTVDAINDHINATIEAVTILNGSGQPVPKYLSRFEVSGSNADGFSLTLKGTITESVKLSEANAQPVLYALSNLSPVITSGPSIGRLVKFDDLNAATPTVSFQADVAASDAQQESLNAKITPPEEGETTPAVNVETTARAVATDSEGFVYVVGTSAGDFDSSRGNGIEDVFLSKYDSNGVLVFSRLLGAAGDSNGFTVTTDVSGNVIVAGQTEGRVANVDNIAGQDSFVVKFDAKGDEVFRYQLDTAATDAGLSVATTATGDVIVAGYAAGTIRAGLANAGGADGYVLRLDGASGTVLDATQFGTTGHDEAQAVTIAADGSILVAGVENGRGIIRKLDGNNLATQLDSFDLGSLSGGRISGIATANVGGVDRVVVSGTTQAGGLAGEINAHAGQSDGFVSILSDNAGLGIDATRYLGTASSDNTAGLVVSGDKLYVTGRTNDALAGQTRQGASDSYVVKIDIATAAVDSTKQFGVFGSRLEASGLALATQGGGVLAKLGLRAGALNQTQTRDIVSQTAVNAGDFFYVAIDNRRPVKIAIQPGDTFARIAARINTLSFRGVKASVTTGSEGGKLEIKAQNNTRVTLIAGEEGRDALARLGLEPSVILPTELLFDLEEADLDPTKNLGGSFGLELDEALHLKDKTTAKFALSKIDNAIATIQRAFRSLTFDPIAFALKQQGRFQGEVPAFLTKQHAGYQDALLRLQLSSLSANSGSFF